MTEKKTATLAELDYAWLFYNTHEGEDLTADLREEVRKSLDRELGLILDPEIKATFEKIVKQAELPDALDLFGRYSAGFARWVFEESYITIDMYEDGDIEFVFESLDSEVVERKKLDYLLRYYDQNNAVAYDLSKEESVKRLRHLASKVSEIADSLESSSRPPV